MGHPVVGAGAARGRRDRTACGTASTPNEETFTDPTIQGAIDTYKGLIDEGLFNENLKTATFEDQGAALLAGDAAMAVQVNSFFGQLQSHADTAELNEKIGFFPISPTGNVGTFIPDQSNALVAFKTGDAKREAAARQLLSYWLGDGYAGLRERAVDRLAAGRRRLARPTSRRRCSTSAPRSADSVGSMQALAVANPDLYLNLADMIQGTKTTGRGRRGDPGAVRRARQGHRRARLLINAGVPAAGAGTPRPEGDTDDHHTRPLQGRRPRAGHHGVRAQRGAAGRTTRCGS